MIHIRRAVQLFLLLLSIPAHALVTASQSDVSSGVSVAIFAASDEDIQADSQPATINSLVADSRATATVGADYVEMSALVSAAWNDTQSGEVTYSIGQLIDLSSAQVPGLLSRTPTIWSYTFDADSRGTISLVATLTTGTTFTNTVRFDGLGLVNMSEAANTFEFDFDSGTHTLEIEVGGIGIGGTLTPGLNENTETSHILSWSITQDTVPPVLAQCEDGIDNDGDGLIDFPQDPGCDSAADDDETDIDANLVINPGFELGVVGWTFSSDPGLGIDVGTCATPCVVPQNGANAAYKNLLGGGAGTIRQSIPTIPGNVYSVEVGLAKNSSAAGTVTAAFGSTVGVSLTQSELLPAYQTFQFQHVATSANTEFVYGGTVAGGTFFLDDIIIIDRGVAPTQCEDGIDNDGDGQVDYPQDLGCSDAADDDETGPATPLFDGQGNLIGATGVIVDGVAYDFVLRETTCAIEYNGCDITEVSDFPFGNSPNNATQAIVDQVLGGLTSDQIFGCSRTEHPRLSFCDLVTPATQSNVVIGGPARVDYLGNTSYSGNYSVGATFDFSTATTRVLVVWTVQQPATECGDGIDNDGDGLIDYPADPGCDGASDDDEFNVVLMQCEDGADNDGDGLIDYPADPGCDSDTDDDEFNLVLMQCEDGVDNDGDGLIDFPADPGCDSASDDDEFNVVLMQCEDGEDNDGDGLIDYPADPGCDSAGDDNEFNIVLRQCEDGEDNDGDGLIDYPADPSCSSFLDNDELNPLAQCEDGIDNDADGLIDFPADPDCSDSNDNFEIDPTGLIEYRYQGTTFTGFSCGGNTTCSIADPVFTSYTTDNSVYATMTLSAGLPGDLLLEDVTNLPGFNLVIGDGLQASSIAVEVLVSTDSEGNIISPWSIISNGPNPPNNGVSTVNWPGVRGVADTGVLSSPSQTYPGTPRDVGLSEVPGEWSMASVLQPPVRGFLDFDTDVTGVPFRYRSTSFSGGEFASLGVTMIDSDMVPSDEVIQVRAIPPNREPLSAYSVHVAPRISVIKATPDTTFLELHLPDGSREVAVDFGTDNGELRLLAYDESGALILQQDLLGDQQLNLKYCPPLRICTADADIVHVGHATVSTGGATIHRVRLEAPSQQLTPDLFIDQRLFIDNFRYEPAIPATASIDEDVVLGTGVVIGEYVTIRSGSVIGDNAEIGDNAVIRRNVQIGAGSMIGGNTLIAAGSVIPPGTILGAGSRIRSDVLMGDLPVIGANVTIASGVQFGDYVTISDGTRLRSNVVLGNDVMIGQDTTLRSDVTVGDRTQIGDDTLVRVAADIGSDVVIGNNVNIAPQAVVPDGTVIPDGSSYPNF